jgi:hypothetical protein
MKTCWLKHIRVERVVAFPRDYGLWRRKLVSERQYLTTCEHAYKNKLEMFTSVLSDYEIANQIVTELFYDIDVEQVEPRDVSSVDASLQPTINSLNSQLRNHELCYHNIIKRQPDVVELIAQLEPIICVVRSLYSGRRGVHLHVDLNPVRIVDLRRAAEYVAELLGIADIVDKKTLGDWRRVSRVPYTYHKLTGNMCMSLNMATNVELMNTLSELLREKFTYKTNSYSVPMSGEVREAVTVLGDPPPCISFLFGRLQAGQLLTHEARLHLGAYLMRIGLKPEEAAVLFTTSPDYDEPTTLYQLRWLHEHNYKMYSCERARQYGLCPLPIDKCKYAPSPNWWL